MTGKADDHKEIQKPQESHPAPEAAQRSGVIDDQSKRAEWKATQQERMRAQEHSATDLLHDKAHPQPKKSKFELVDDASAKHDATVNHPPDWLELGRKLAGLPLQTQAQIIGNGLLAGIEQYSHEQREREWGALIGTVQGVGDTAINLAKIADFCAYCTIGDKERAGKMGADFGAALGQSIVSGVNVFEGAKEYANNIQKTGDIGKPIRDVIALGQILDREWEKLPPREQERQKFELIGQLVSDGLIGTHGAQAMGRATKFTEILGSISKAAAEHGGQKLEVVKKAASKISDLTKDLLSPELAVAGVGKIKASQLEKGAENIAKSIGRYSEYVPEKKPLFLNVSENRLLKENDLALHGGLKKLESLTAEELEKLGIKRFELPKLNLWWDTQTFSASIPEKFAALNAAVLEKGVIDIVRIRKGWLPEGAGSHFLAEALKAHKAIPTKELICSLITNPQTKEAFEKGLPAEESLLGKFMIKALKELGLKAESAQWVKREDSINIVIKIKR